MHYIDSIVTSNNLQNLSYDYDKFGNFEARKDNLRNLEETFHYDNMNRLTDIPSSFGFAIQAMNISIYNAKSAHINSV